MNKEKLVRRTGVALVLLVSVGAIAGSPSTTTTYANTATPTINTQMAATAAAVQKLKPYQRPASFYIDVTASVEGQHIRVGGTTNLPDGTILTLNAERDFKQTHDAERVDFLGLNGPTQANVAVHATHFNGELSAQEENLAALMQGDPGGPVSTVDPNADLCVVLYTGRDGAVNGPWRQPPQVRADLGAYGSFLRGSHDVGTFGSLTKHPSLYILATTHVPLDPSALVRDLVAVQTLRPQVAALPNICSA